MGEDERVLWRADAAAIQEAQCAVTAVSARRSGPAVSVPATLVGCDSVERLVELRLLHQTQRTAKSVRSRGESRATTAQDTGFTETSTMAKRRELCKQMADVIRRVGSGVERCARWKLAPGTLDSFETSQLSGNAANAEVVARDRVDMVSCSPFPFLYLPVEFSPMQAMRLRRSFFTPTINFSRYLADGLVGSEGQNHSTLKSGSWAFVFSEGAVYVGEGI